MIRQFRSWHKYTNRSTYSSIQHLPLSFSDHRRSNDQKLMNPSYRTYSLTTRKENPLIIGGISVLALAGSLHVGMMLYQQYQEKKASAPTEEAPTTNSSDDQNSTINETATKTSTSKSEEAASKSKTEKKKEETSEPSSGFFGNFFATTFYDGGFEEKMTKREAALILGVRESASIERIKDAHRRILINNHPDRGGSPYIAAKVNEAKDFLLKGKPNV